MSISAIVTIPPYAPFLDEVARHPIVSGLRLNTVMPVKETLDDLLKRLNDKAAAEGKKLWVDLKCRQLRVATYGVPPFTEIRLTHKIEVNVPVTAYFSDGEEHATVVGVQGDRLLMLEGPKRVIGPGESVNIPDPSLKVDGYFTDTDLRYIEAGAKIGLYNYMLSFVEGQNDIEALLQQDKDAVVVAKIESLKGIQYVNNAYAALKDGQQKPTLMAARGDLFVELEWPHDIIKAVETIVKSDPRAIAASRIFNSLSEQPMPSCADIGDVDNLLRMGYKTLMLGDDVCQQRDSVMGALNLFQALAQRYEVKAAKP